MQLYHRLAGGKIDAHEAKEITVGHDHRAANQAPCCPAAEEIVVFPKTDLPIEEIVIVSQKPEESSENFTGPPSKNNNRRLLEENIINDWNTIS